MISPYSNRNRAVRARRSAYMTRETLTVSVIAMVSMIVRVVQFIVNFKESLQANLTKAEAASIRAGSMRILMSFKRKVRLARSRMDLLGVIVFL